MQAVDKRTITWQLPLLLSWAYKWILTLNLKIRIIKKTLILLLGG